MSKNIKRRVRTHTYTRIYCVRVRLYTQQQKTDHPQGIPKPTSFALLQYIYYTHNFIHFDALWYAVVY